ncbi:hypothetical protein C8Q80DRAFT_1271364 [Daedaleopsis nitida]|nr:hypothetical protein C8Q80DRAFT_1271364 [Daedaleopsis nitida]
MPALSTLRRPTDRTVRTIWELNGCSCLTCRLDDILGPVDRQNVGLLQRHPTLDFCPCTCHDSILHDALTRILDHVDQYDILEGAFDTTPIYERGYRSQRTFELPTRPHTRETLRAWNEAKAMFGIGEDEEPEGDPNDCFP